MAIASKLTDEARKTIVCALAAYDTPSTIAALIRSRYDISVSPQAIETYDPTKYAGRNLAPKWKAMFAAARKQFLEESAAIGITHKTVRLKRLDRMSLIAEDKGNIPLAAQLLEQAAKECGDAFTNRHRVDGTLMHRTDPREMTDDELAAIAAGGSP